MPALGRPRPSERRRRRCRRHRPAPPSPGADAGEAEATPVGSSRSPGSHRRRPPTALSPQPPGLSRARRGVECQVRPVAREQRRRHGPDAARDAGSQAQRGLSRRCFGARTRCTRDRESGELRTPAKNDPLVREPAGRVVGPTPGRTDDAAGGIATDGSFFAGVLSSLPTPDREYIAYVRRSDGSSPARLGTGIASGVTPDGKWVITSAARGRPDAPDALPDGPGTAPAASAWGSVEPQVGGVNQVTCSADGRRLGFLGIAPGEGGRAYVVDSAGGAAPRAVSPDGMTSVTLSPDGERVAAVDAEGELRIYAVGGGPPSAGRGCGPRRGPRCVGLLGSGSLRLGPQPSWRALPPRPRHRPPRGAPPHRATRSRRGDLRPAHHRRRTRATT